MPPLVSANAPAPAPAPAQFLRNSDAPIASHVTVVSSARDDISNATRLVLLAATASLATDRVLSLLPRRLPQRKPLRQLQQHFPPTPLQASPMTAKFRALPAAVPAQLQIIIPTSRRHCPPSPMRISVSPWPSMTRSLFRRPSHLSPKPFPRPRLLTHLPPHPLMTFHNLYLPPNISSSSTMP